MLSSKQKTGVGIQSIVLLGGAVFAWTTIYDDFIRFFSDADTIFQFTGCKFPNPLATPCFYGGIAFVIALVWSIMIFKGMVKDATLQQKRLTWLLAAGTAFAASVFGKQVWKFFANNGEPTIGCSGVLMTNPLQTPCFGGFAFFATAFVVAIVIYLVREKKKSGAEEK